MSNKVKLIFIAMFRRYMRRVRFATLRRKFGTGIGSELVFA